MFHRMAKRRCRVEGGKHARTRRFDVGLEPFNLLLRGCVRGLCLGERRRRRVAGMVGLVSGPVSSASARRAGSRLDSSSRSSARYFLSPRRQHLDVMPIELLLLLTTIDVELSGVSILANPRRTGIGLRLLESQARLFGLHLRDTWPTPPPRALGRRRVSRARRQSFVAAHDSGARRAPFPNAAAPPEAACIDAPSPPAA